VFHPSHHRVPLVWSIGAGALAALVVVACLVGVMSTPVELETALGFLAYGGASGLVYGLIFRVSRRSGPYIGAWIGCVHWILAIGFLSFLPSTERHLPISSATGSVGLYLGSLCLHLLYGAIVGALHATGTHRASAYSHDPIGEASERLPHSGKRR
jgi:hypothetical protein